MRRRDVKGAAAPSSWMLDDNPVLINSYRIDVKRIKVYLIRTEYV